MKSLLWIRSQCADVVIDPTASSGQAGPRPWTALSWFVSAANCKVANCSVIQNYLNKNVRDTSAVFTVPNNLFQDAPTVNCNNLCC